MKVEVNIRAPHGVTVDDQHVPTRGITTVEFDLTDDDRRRLGYPIMIGIHDDEGRQLIAPVGVDIGPRGGVRLVR